MEEKGWIGITAVLSALTVYLLYALFQPTYTYALLDSRYDAHQYARAYDYFKGFTIDYTVSFPFNTRILMPWLAAKLPFNDLVTDFIWLNGFFIVAAVGLLIWVWLQLGIRPFWMSITLFWILFHWKGLIRMYLPDPVTADVGGYFLLTSLLVVFLVQINKGPIGARNWVVMGAITVFGTLQKESFLAVMGLTMAVFFTKKGSTAFGVPTLLLLCFCLSLSVYYIIDFFFPSAHKDWRNHYIVSVLRGMRRYAEQPNLFFRIPVSWFLAYGTFWLALVPFRFLKSMNNSLSDASLLAYHFSLWLFLSVFGGGDTTRILYNGMPFILTFFLLKLNRLPPWTSWYVLLTSLPLMRLFKLEPDLGRYPSAMQQWCVECWSVAESWGYWVYAIVVLSGYYYLFRCLGAIRSDKSNEINTLS